MSSQLPLEFITTSCNEKKPTPHIGALKYLLTIDYTPHIYLHKCL